MITIFGLRLLATGKNGSVGSFWLIDLIEEQLRVHPNLKDFTSIVDASGVLSGQLKLLLQRMSLYQ